MLGAHDVRRGRTLERRFTFPPPVDIWRMTALITHIYRLYTLPYYVRNRVRK